MSRIAYVNGRYVPHGQAVVHIEDRGYQLADGVYEVWALFGGRLVDADGHFERLGRSLTELRIRPPMTRRALEIVLAETVRRNRVREGLVYLQVTRGTARRDHAFPNPAPPPSVVVTAKAVDWAAADARAAVGASVVTTPENRWGRCDIKTIGLLPNVLAKQAARERGAIEAWFVDDLGLVTEGASSNAWIVDKDGVLRTRDTNANILRGVTRRAVFELVAREGLTLSEAPFSPEDAKAAREAFITGAGSLVTPIVAIDGVPIGNGRPGPVATRLRALYVQNARAL
ncbi:D-amino acid aminotransferase [Caulobacter sp. CCUG 60055]|uniref:D-amino-acid transaminase n=2 Tax=Pseudomonadota TaxID=1224 RepID=UPI001FA6BB5C|nr:D-amino-acid transaminase [Caulobacter sp. CCUG 60055]MBQ1540638.1 D-amino-acid transaminase [Caulobacteraceae bacterium]MCI3178881.1 D-amino acid aminotransferase [Caulobacter sp. CCUG 60055]